VPDVERGHRQTELYTQRAKRLSNLLLPCTKMTYKGVCYTQSSYALFQIQQIAKHVAIEVLIAVTVKTIATLDLSLVVRYKFTTMLRNLGETLSYYMASYFRAT
jgi:hypothetical protein